jgi:hypothetical protein
MNNVYTCTRRYILSCTHTQRSQPLFKFCIVLLATLTSFQSTLEPFIACSILPLSSILNRQTTQASLATPKLPQPGVDLIDIAVLSPFCSSCIGAVLAICSVSPRISRIYPPRLVTSGSDSSRIVSPSQQVEQINFDGKYYGTERARCRARSFC